MRIIFFFCLFLFSSQCLAQQGLDFYLSEAINNSPLLKDYQNQVLANKVDSLRLLGSFKPQVYASTYNTYAPVIGGWGYDNAISNGGNFNTQVFVNKALIPKKNLSNQLENITLQSKGLQATAKISEQDLKRTITAQYVTTYGDLLQIKFNEEVLTLFKNEEKIIKTLTESNVYRQTEYLTFLVTLQQQELLIKRLRIQYLNDLGTLKYLAGITDTQVGDIAAPNIALPQLPEIQSSIFYKPFVFDSLKIRNNDRQIDFNYKIKSNIFADGGFSSTLVDMPYKNFGTSFGFSASVPIYDGRQKGMQHTKNKIAELTRQNYRDFFLKQYNQQLAQLYQQLSLFQELTTDMTKQLKYSERLIAANNKLLSIGDVRIVDYLLAISNYMNAKNQLTFNEINRLQLINQVNYWKE